MQLFLSFLVQNEHRAVCHSKCAHTVAINSVITDPVRSNYEESSTWKLVQIRQRSWPLLFCTIRSIRELQHLSGFHLLCWQDREILKAYAAQPIHSVVWIRFCDKRTRHAGQYAHIIRTAKIMFKPYSDRNHPEIAVSPNAATSAQSNAHI